MFRIQLEIERAVIQMVRAARRQRAVAIRLGLAQSQFAQTNVTIDELGAGSQRAHHFTVCGEIGRLHGQPRTRTGKRARRGRLQRDQTLSGNVSLIECTQERGDIHAFHRRVECDRLTTLEADAAARLKTRLLPGHIELVKCDGGRGISCVGVEREARQAADRQGGRVHRGVNRWRRNGTAEAGVETDLSSDRRADERAPRASQKRFRIGDDPCEIRRAEVQVAAEDLLISERYLAIQCRAQRAEILDIEHDPLIACRGDQTASHWKDVP